MSNSPDSLQNEYRLRFAESEQYRNAVWKILCEDYFTRLIPPESHVLDLGSGWAEFINNIAAARKYAMDLNPDAERRLVGDAQFLHQDCSKPWPLDSGSLDVVFTSNFLEHLPSKAHVESAVSEAHRCLKENGRIVCLGPNIKYTQGAYWDFWDHFVPLTDHSLGELLEIVGFGIDMSVPRFLPYSMSTGRQPPLILLKLYLRMPPLWRFFGKQFLVVGRKKPISNATQPCHTR